MSGEQKFGINEIYTYFVLYTCEESMMNLMTNMHNTFIDDYMIDIFKMPSHEVGLLLHLFGIMEFYIIIFTILL